MEKGKKVLENVSAIEQSVEDSAVIGYLAWYSVGEALYDRETLRKGLITHGLEESLLPKPIRPPDAFRRATKAIETKRKEDERQPNEYRNYIIRDVVNTAAKLQRNIVVETVNQKGEQLDYESEGAKLYFDKKQSNFSYEAKDLTCEELAEEAQLLFERFLTHHNGAAVRGSVITYLNQLSPIPVRPSGGVYFIPYKHEAKLRRFVGFVSSLDRGESYMIPLVRNDENRNMIRDKVKDHLCKENIKRNKTRRAGSFSAVSCLLFIRRTILCAGKRK